VGEREGEGKRWKVVGEREGERWGRKVGTREGKEKKGGVRCGWLDPQ
jgi:hypothetical protein